MQPTVVGLSSGSYVVSWSGTGVDGSLDIDSRLYASSNLAPIGKGDAVTCVPDQALIIDPAVLLANDSDPEGDTFGVVGVTDALHGSVVLNAAGMIVFTPEANYLGKAGFSYVVRDVQGAESKVWVEVPVLPNLTTGPVRPLATTIAGDQHSASTTALPDGGYVAIWTDAANGIVGQRFNASGDKAGAEFAVGPGSGWNGVSAFPDGGFIVAYFNGSGISTRRYAADGSALGGPQTAWNGTNDARRVRVETLADGGYALTWDALYAGSWHIHVQGFNGDGSVRGAAAVLDHDGLAPDVAGLAGGGYAVSWAYREGTYAAVQLFDSRGMPTSTIRASSTLLQQWSDGTWWYGAPSVTGMSDGGFVVTWNARTDTGSAITFRRYDASGFALTGEIQAAFDPNWMLGASDVTAMADGGFVLSWQGGDGSGRGIYTRRYDAASNPSESAQLVNGDATGEQVSSSVAGLENGGYVVTWHGPSVQGGSDVQSRLFAVAGMVVEGASAADTLSGGSGADTFLAGNGSGADRIDNHGHGDDGDSVALATGIIASQLWFERAGSDLRVSVIGTADSVTVADWYLTSANHVSRFATADGRILADTQVETLVSAMSAFAPPPLGQTALTVEQQQALDPVLAAAWQGS